MSQPRHLAKLPIRTRANLCRLLAAVVACKPVARLAILLAAVRNGAGIAIVGIDATQNTPVDGDDVVHNKVACPAVVLAVAAAPGNFAIVLDIEVLDVDGPEPVELDHLVGSMESAATNDVACAAGLEERAKKGSVIVPSFVRKWKNLHGVLADVFPPNVDQSACASTMHTFGLVRANNDLGGCEQRFLVKSRS